MMNFSQLKFIKTKSHKSDIEYLSTSVENIIKCERFLRNYRQVKKVKIFEFSLDKKMHKTTNGMQKKLD